MNTFDAVFNNKKAFVAYITAGHNGLDYTEAAGRALIDGGVDILEIGIPFSDPVADGPVIQQAMNQALEAPINLTAIFNTIKKIKKYASTPIVLFSYYNPLFACGLEKALEQAALAGVDGILIVDLPFEESEAYFKLCAKHGLKPICLISPSTAADKIEKLNQVDSGFLYYVCRNGTTGVKNNLPHDYKDKMQQLKKLTAKPIVCGFGIGNSALAQQALAHAHGFVVGSAFVNAISNGASAEDLKQLALKINPR